MRQENSPFMLMETVALETRMAALLGQFSRMTMADIINADAAYRAYAFDEAAQEPVRKPYAMNGSVATIELTGTMSKRSSWMSYYFGGGAATQTIGSTLDIAAKDPAVSSILLKIDSPGGNVDGTAQLAQAIQMARDAKPVWAWVDGQMCSAALWVGIHADAVYASTEMDAVGSIGVITCLIDQSGSTMLKESGYKVYKIDTGENKAIGAYFSPITDSQIALIQNRVDAVGSEFINVVNQERGINLVLGEYAADGRVLSAREAQGVGLIDGIAPLPSILSRMNENYNLRRQSIRRKKAK